MSYCITETFEISGLVLVGNDEISRTLNPLKIKAVVESSLLGSL